MAGWVKWLKRLIVSYLLWTAGRLGCLDCELWTVAWSAEINTADTIELMETYFDSEIILTLNVDYIYAFIK